MKRLATDIRLLFAVVLALGPLQMLAGPQLHNLDIKVALRDNGDAEIVETRTMTIDSEGTECYIVIGNLNGSTIKDFAVTDERGTRYTNIGSWDVDRSRSYKAGKCGIVTKSDGVELCWGLGDSGSRVYTVSYVVTDFFKAYEESDGFLWMFVTPNMNPSAEEVKIEIVAPDLPAGLPDDSVHVWSFGHAGQINKMGGTVEAYTTQALTTSNYVTVMVEIEKGVMHPKMQGNGSFKDLRKVAFEGSDYKEETWLSKFWNECKSDPTTMFLVIGIPLFIILYIVYSIRTAMSRKKFLKTVDWYREIPVGGNLLTASAMINAYYVSDDIKSENIIGAQILRMIRVGALRVEKRYVQPSGFRKAFGAQPELKDCIVIGDFEVDNRLINTSAIPMLYDMFRKASGDDLVLQPNELNRWMKANETEVMAFIKAIKKKMSRSECKARIDDVRKVFGLRKFLEDFTLANERHLSEVSLWKDYLIYATLFGIADQVKADMMKLNPEYLRMDEIARSLTNNTVVPLLISTTQSTTRSVQHTVESRNSGGGGSSSWGGGGGFSGGGSGGGVR